VNADPAQRFVMPAEWSVSVAGETTTVVYEPADSQSAVFVCAHGAGGHMADRGLLKVAETMRSVGLGVVRFNFLYRAKRSSRPDPMPRLMECISAVVARVRDEVAPRAIVIGGRSMGGRAASMLAADGFTSDGLLLLAYPLHPAGQPDKLRDAHLPAIKMPVLCVNGTRDPLCRRDLMERAVQTVTTRWTMRWLEGADHSFHVLKSSGRTDSEVLQDVAEATRSWLTASIA
jgi:predicted alpha/beta-hydrolase family hydrolase